MEETVDIFYSFKINSKYFNDFFNINHTSSSISSYSSSYTTKSDDKSKQLSVKSVHNDEIIKKVDNWIENRQ